MSEFICPSGKLSVNGVCGIFEGPGKAVQDFTKKSTYDFLSEDEIFGEKDTKEEKDVFEFDFEKPTESFNKKASNIINENINYYNQFVQDKLGISSQTQNTIRAVSAFGGLASGGGIMAAIGPYAVPFMLGAALKNQDQKQQEAAINRESVKDLQERIDEGQFGSNTPTPQDEAKTNYGGSTLSYGGSTLSSGSIGSRGPGMSGYGGGADMGGGSPGSSGPGGSDEMGSF